MAEQTFSDRQKEFALLERLRIWGDYRSDGSERAAMASAIRDAIVEIKRLRTRLARYEPPAMETEYGPKLRGEAGSKHSGRACHLSRSFVTYPCSARLERHTACRSPGIRPSVAEGLPQSTQASMGSTEAHSEDQTNCVAFASSFLHLTPGIATSTGSYLWQSSQSSGLSVNVPCLRCIGGGSGSTVSSHWQAYDSGSVSSFQFFGSSGSRCAGMLQLF